TCFRYIELSNGLKALLISDLTQSESNREPVAKEEEDSGEEEDGDSESTNEDSNCVNKCSEGFFTVILIFVDISYKMSYIISQSAAALCISVGSFSDPADLPGLAHFLEHMVFMGSEKYPAENGFDAFLKKHGGSDNASTDCERTIFKFDVQRKYLREALDRWVQFFIGPLMIPDAVDREVEAVDSEYQMAQPLDSNRKEMLFGGLAKAGHPMSKFFWGNAQTLKNEPREKNIDTYERLREFWRRYYSAHYMTLAVQSKETLDNLEEWVRAICIKIPNNGQPRADFSDLQDPFDTPDFNKLYRVVPVRKIHALTISWALPPQDKHYRVKPLHYISWLIGHEGAGSVLSLLRKKCWALALFGGNSESGFDQNTTYSIFSVSITLSDEGFQNFFQVIHIVFQYLKMLQSVGPQQRIYEEIQKIEANEFHYQEQMEPIEFVANICENMQLFPKEDFLRGDQLMFEYNPEVISAPLTLLTPATANILLLSPEHDGRCPLNEKWFGTQYSVEGNPPPQRIWEKCGFVFRDPPVITHLNKFIYINLKLILVLFDLFVNILAHNLAEPAYDADVAQLEYMLFPGDHGLFIRLKGFNHKLPLLLNLIVDHLANFSTAPNVFSMYIEQLKKTYYIILIKPDRLGRDVRLQILEHHRWSVMQKYEAIMADLGVTDLMDFVNRFKAELFVEGLIQGNFTSAESKEFLQYFIEKLQYKAPPAEPPVLFRVVELPQTHHLCKVQSLNKADANSEVTVYYQVMVMTALIKLKECEDTQLGEEVDRNWFEVVTQQYVFDRLNKEIEVLKNVTKDELVSFFMEHRHASSRKLSIHVVGFGEKEKETHGDDQSSSSPESQDTERKTSSYGDVSELIFLPASPVLAKASRITDIRAFTSSLNLHPYHKILQ
uniref:Nardilysin-like n=1 Tax=Sinocyclocheilus rhinocerous TaxID=307959 RepID=A0A673JT71_9TELE